MEMVKRAMFAMTAGALVVMLGGCPQKEGPGERAGKAVDSAAEKTGKKIEKAGEAIQDAAKDDKKK
jgi:hypothetical protein